MKPIRAAILGLGRIAWRLEQDKLRYHPCTHFGALNAPASGFALAGACDIDPEAVQTFLRFAKARDCVTGADAREVLRAAKPELVIIAASLEAHESLVKTAVRQGARAILLEKPPALTFKGARRLLEICRDIPVWVNFERRYHPHYALVRSMVQAAGAAQVRSIRGRVLAGSAPGAGGSGPLLHDAIHWIDLLFWIAGSPVHVESRQLMTSGVEHTSFLRFDYPEFSAALESGGRRKYFEFEMEIDLDSSRICCGNSGFRLYESKGSNRYSKFYELIPKQWKLPRWQNPWEMMYREIQRYLRKSEPVMTSSLYNAVEAMRWINTASRQ